MNLKNLKKFKSFSTILAVIFGTVAVAIAGYVTVGIVSCNEKPAETLAPESEPSVSESESEAPPEPIIEALGERELREIHLLSEEEIAAISENFSTETVKFFVGTLHKTDDLRRPEVVNTLETSLLEKEIPAKFYCADVTEKKVSFIFFAEKEGTYTEEVLDILKEYGIKSTFFVTRAFEGNHSENITRMIEEGHEIGNRSYLDPNGGIAARALKDQMTDAKNLQDYMSRAYDYTMQKYSFSSDLYSEASVALMAGMGYEVCFGSMNFSDEGDEALNRDEVLAALISGLHPGAVYSFHLVNESVPEILKGLIDYCVSEQYVLKQLD